MLNYQWEIKILNKLYFLVVIFHVVFAEKHDHIEVNYDIDKLKILHVNHTLELICKNKLNSNPPSWTYPRRMYNNPRVKFNIDVGESRMVISKAEAEDAGKYKCDIEHEYQGKTIYFSKDIEVIVNEIKKVEEVETDNNGIKLLCNVQAYPPPDVVWKIDYANEALNPPTEAPDLDDDYWTPTDPRVLVDKSNGRLKLQAYKGVNNAELIINNATENDNGKYYCVARNIASEECKDCTVNRPKRGVASEGKSSTVSVDDVTTNILGPKSSQKGLGAGIITLIVLAILVLFGAVIGVYFWIKGASRIKEMQNTEEPVTKHTSIDLKEQNDEEHISLECVKFEVSESIKSDTRHHGIRYLMMSLGGLKK